ncbi:MAG TPA: M20/M25/M40 family metallo-hydrolase [Candidatus Angelobacter sp.]
MSTTKLSSPSQLGAPSQPAPSGSFLSASLAWCFIFGAAALAIYLLKAPDAVPATSPADQFSAERALTHVRAIAQAPHPIGSVANAAARDYLAAQLSALGMNPQVVTAMGITNAFGAVIAGRTHDVVARLPGTANSGAILLLSHYDSVSSGPGAADDAAGVAAILEAVRALKTAPPLKNDLIVLITDGEEAGLLGAEAFVSSHPWVKEVGLILNFEARGNRGPSLLFETSANNASLIREFSSAAPYPTASSLFYALYKLLPNDTDFTVFRPTRIPGLNFAFGGHLEAYHSWLDTPDNLDTASLQHQGSYVLSLVQRFGQMDLGKLKQQTGDDVFFDWLGSNLISYSESWVVIGEAVASLLLVLAIVVAVKRGEARGPRLALGLLSSLLLLLIIPAVMAAAEWLLQFLGPRELLGDTPANSFLLVGLIVLGAAVGGAALGKLRRFCNLQELSLAGLVVVCILSWAVALLLPAGSYLLFWPLFLTTIGLLVLQLTGVQSPGGWLAGTLIGAVMTILIFAPIGYLLYIFLTLNLQSVAAIGLLVGLFFIICIPLINMAIPQLPWRTILLPMLAGAAVCLGIGMVQSRPSAQHPREDSLLYSLNADDHTAVWLSYDNALDAFTSQLIPAGKSKRQPLPNYLTGSRAPVLSGAADVVDLKPPISEIKADEQNGDLYTVHMNVRSQRNAYFMFIRFDPSVKPVTVNISGRSTTPNPGPAGLVMLLYGMGTEGADLELKLQAANGVSFWISDYSTGLPTTLRRTSDLIASQRSDQTLVCRKYVLGAPAK